MDQPGEGDGGERGWGMEKRRVRKGRRGRKRV
jgi:hypothetical protein